MVAFKVLAASLLLGLVAADECPALSNTFGFKPKNLFDLETVDCRVGIQAAECATNLRQSYGQTWAAFRINHNKDCNHGAPYGDCCCFAGKPPIDPSNLEPNPSVWLFFWDDIKTGTNPAFGTQCIQDPTTGCCARQDAGHVTVTGGCPYKQSTAKDADGNYVIDMFGRVGDGCPKKPGEDGGAGGAGHMTSQDGSTPVKPKTKPKKGDALADAGGDAGTGTGTGSDGGSGDNGDNGDNGETTTSETGSGGESGSRLARFRLFRRQSSKKKTNQNDNADGGAENLSSTGGGGGGGKGGGKGDDRRVKSGAGPGGFPKCGPYGNFGPAKQCQKNVNAMCKPGVKNKGKGGNMGRMPKGGTGDLDGTTCPNGKGGGGSGRLTGVGGGKGGGGKGGGGQGGGGQGGGGLRGTEGGGGTTGGGTTGDTTDGGDGDVTINDESTSESEQTTNKRQRRWAGMDSSADLLKRWPGGGNQFDSGNCGQLSPKGRCCWCKNEICGKKGGGKGGGGGGEKGGSGKGGSGKGGSNKGGNGDD